MNFSGGAKAPRRAVKTGVVMVAATAALLGLAAPAQAATRALTSTSSTSASTPAPGSVTLTQVGSSAEAVANWTYPFSAPASQETTVIWLYRDRKSVV